MYKEVKDNYPTLDEIVLQSLDLLEKSTLPKLPKVSKSPLIIGSGNAFVTGQIIFKNSQSIFADESSYEDILRNLKIKEAYLLSASGSKHAGIIVSNLRKNKVSFKLLTNNSRAAAIDKANIQKNELIFFPSTPEPYTYNTSTYASMIFASTKENPTEIKNFITKVINKNMPSNLANFDNYFIILPSKFHLLVPMLRTKFDELFGMAVPAMIFTDEQAKHAKDVVLTKNTLSIELGEVSYHIRNTQKVKFSLPKKSDYGALMLISYYIIGQIQKGKKPYYLENIEEYCKSASKTFKTNISSWVDYSIKI